MISCLFHKAALFLTSLLTAGLLFAQNFQPIPLAELEIRTFSGLMNSLSNFVSQVKPEAAGQLIFLSAAVAMNPQTAAIDLNKPLRAVLLTGAGKTATDAAGHYQPDLFFCLSAHLRQGAQIEDSIATFGGPLTVRRLSGDRILLYSTHPLFIGQLDAIEKKFFPTASDRAMADFKLILNLKAVSRIPGITSSVKNAVMTSPDWNPACDNILSDTVDSLAEQIQELSIKLNFLDASTISLTGTIVPDKGTPLVTYLRSKPAGAFDMPSTFKAADSYTLIAIPPASELKRTLLKEFANAGLPAYLQECVMRSNGKALLSENRALGLQKLSLELENGAMPHLLSALGKDKTVHRLPSGIWMLDCQENRQAVFAEVRDNKFLLVAGKLTEPTALRLLNDPTPLPAQVEAGTSAVSHFLRLKSGTIVRKGDLHLTTRGIDFAFKISASDFPRKPSALSEK